MLEPVQATIKSKDLLRMAVAKARLLEPLRMGSLSVDKAALVIGGGLAGMTSALELAGQDFQVYLVEKEKELGGNLRRIRYLLDGEDPKKHLEGVIGRTQANAHIQLFTDAKIEAMEGSIGHYKTKISTNGDLCEVEHGIVIIASGAKEYQPKEYLYGQDSRIMTQRELEDAIVAPGKQLFKRKGKKPSTVVMIQCVGSREDERPSCSRICCAEAVKNALKIKEVSPDTRVYILYRDVRTYGFKEKYYTQARQKGVAFIRWEKEQRPEVVKESDGLVVKVFDQILKMPLEIPADTVVLSAGVVPNEDAKTIAQFVKVPLTQEGFFLEAHMKLRPVDFATDGVFLCGLAHAPKAVEESVIQAQAVASRASTILSKDHIELEANISTVIDENCDGCAYCVEPCPYKAVSLLEYMWQGAVKKTVEVNEGLCKGCGCCMATCPKRGVFVKGFTLDQIQAQVDAALQGG
jgi:heterodisulfide reductase subunit A